MPQSKPERTQPICALRVNRLTQAPPERLLPKCIGSTEALMRKSLSAGLILIAATIATPLSAQQQLSGPPQETTVTPLSATAANILVRAAEDPQSNGTPDPALLKAVVTWLTTEFDLAPSDTLPRVKLESPAAITQRRHQDTAASGLPVSDAGRETIAIFDSSEDTIYLPNGWSEYSPTDLSVLVHEMVHHLQTAAKTRFECPQAREQLAYTAQQRWLERFGRNLMDDFQLDPFTILVTTRCMF
jgi:hypothetical protein